MQIPSCDKITNFMVTVIGTGSNSLHNGLNGFLQLVEGVQLHHHDGRHPHLWHFQCYFHHQTLPKQGVHLFITWNLLLHIYDSGIGVHLHVLEMMSGVQKINFPVWSISQITPSGLNNGSSKSFITSIKNALTAHLYFSYNIVKSLLVFTIGHIQTIFNHFCFDSNIQIL